MIRGKENMMNDIKILVADDHDLVRKGLKNILNVPPDMHVAGEAKSAEEVMGCLQDKKFDALILDISLPGKNGLDILPDIKRNFPELPVVVFSIYPEKQFGQRARRAGASAYVCKGCEPSELIETVRAIVH